MKRAFIFHGGWEGHQPTQFAERTREFLEGKGFNVTLSDTLAPLTDIELMKSMDLIVPIWTMGSIEEEALKGLLEAVRSGTGLAGWHGGMGDSFRDKTDYQFMVGGQFVAHPGNIIPYTVNVTKPEDPIMAGIGDFTVKSEQYYMHVDPANEVLATTTFSGDHAPWVEGVVVPVVWKKRYGQGRVFYSSLGHHADEFDVLEVWQLTTRGMLWACH